MTLFLNALLIATVVAIATFVIIDPVAAWVAFVLTCTLYFAKWLRRKVTARITSRSLSS